MAIWVNLLAALGEPDEFVLLAGCDVHAAASTRAPTAGAAARHLRIGWTRSLTGCSLLVPSDRFSCAARSPGPGSGQASGSLERCQYRSTGHSMPFDKLANVEFKL